MMDGNKLCVITLNIRSLRKNYDEFILYLKNEKLSPDIIILTESWIREDEKNLFTIARYDLFVVENLRGRSGGVAIYSKNELSAIYKNLSTSSCNAVGLYTKEFIVIGVYRFCTIL